MLLELWEDLKQKRLLPVAGALVLAMIATPVLFKPSVQSSTDTTAPAETSEVRPLVALAQVSEIGPSNLEAFDAKDPFRPVGELRDVSDPSPSSPSSPNSPDGTSGDSSSASSSTGGSGGSATSDGPSGGSTSDVPGSGTEDVNTGKDEQTTDSFFYTYTVDVEVASGGNQDIHRDVEKLTLLPSEKNPLFVFLGTSTSGKTAMFLVDSTLTQKGEGECKPDNESCRFLYLQDDEKQDSHTFTDPDGKRYRLRLLETQQQQVDPATGSTAGIGTLRPISAFLFPLVDLQR